MGQFETLSQETTRNYKDVFKTSFRLFKTSYRQNHRKTSLKVLKNTIDVLSPSTAHTALVLGRTPSKFITQTVKYV